MALFGFAKKIHSTKSNGSSSCEDNKEVRTSDVSASDVSTSDVSTSDVSSVVLSSHMNGNAIPMSQVEEEVFAGGILGQGVAVRPDEGKLYAPIDATVLNLMETKHAICLKAGSVEILLHIGIDTVNLQGKHFEAHVENGQFVKKGQLLISFDLQAIQDLGYKLTTPMIITNTADFSSIDVLKTGVVTTQDNVLEVKLN